MWIYKAHSVSKQAESEAPKIKIKLSKLPPIEPNIVNFFLNGRPPDSVDRDFGLQFYWAGR